MRLTYQTGIATLIQLAGVSVLNVMNAFNSGISQCTGGNTNCVENIILQLLYLMVITIWFAFVWIIGAAAQDRRSKRMARLLIAAEVMIFVVSTFNARHHNSATTFLALLTSLIDAAFAVWVIVLAIRLLRSGGARVTASPRARRRRLAK